MGEESESLQRQKQCKVCAGAGVRRWVEQGSSGAPSSCPAPEHPCGPGKAAASLHLSPQATLGHSCHMPGIPPFSGLICILETGNDASLSTFFQLWDDISEP